MPPEFSGGGGEGDGGGGDGDGGGGDGGGGDGDGGGGDGDGSDGSPVLGSGNAAAKDVGHAPTWSGVTELHAPRCEQHA